MRAPERQRGVAALALVGLLLVAILAGLLTLINQALSQGASNRVRNAAVLQQAKTALVGYVAKEVLDLTNPVPGRLPCPESPGSAGNPDLEGIAAGSCAPAFPSNKTVGRLPWRTLGIDKVVDSASEPLWYAVSPNWVYNGAYPVINAGTPGQLGVDGTTDVVAVIIAPGAPLSISPNAAQAAAGCVARVQARNDRSHVSSSTVDPDYRDYLECENATSPIDGTFGSSVTDNATRPVLNDQVVYVTARDILNAIQGPLAERTQRTVAPLLSEFSAGWVSGGNILPTASNTLLATFLPYAMPFAAPESGTALQSHCGSTVTPTREGLLPVASMALTGACASPWSGFTWTGSVGGTSCVTNPATGAVTCQFTYYRQLPLAVLGGLTLFQWLGLTTPASIVVTLRADAPYGASAFRTGLRATNVSIAPSAKVTSATFTQTPQVADGSARLNLQLQITDGELCEDVPLWFVCSSLGAFWTTSHTITVQFPALSDPTLMGTQLAAPVMSGTTPPFNLLNPAATDPHYWFMRNQWYRYAYYAVSPSASAAGAGGNLTVNGFPATFGLATDKRFVLALVGPAVTGQTRAAGAALTQYVEGANAATGASPRVFAYQVFGNAGNDRIATCPFSAGATVICN